MRGVEVISGRQPTMVSVEVSVRRCVGYDDAGNPLYGEWQPQPTVYWHRNPFRRLAHWIDTRLNVQALRPIWKQWE
jgi:hypothetical protein